MPTPASAAIVPIGTCSPSRWTAAVAARISSCRLRSASLRSSRGGAGGVVARAIVSFNLVDFGGTDGRRYASKRTKSSACSVRKRANMTDDPTHPAPPTIPPDDQGRRLTLARPDEDESLPHLGLVGDTYTILVAGSDTNG